MAALKQVTSQYYRPELDVVRFLAFIFVFLHHELPGLPDPRISSILKGCAPVLYASANACGYGLCLFFVLSAFLICELLLREREITYTVRTKQFYYRRILRIWPLYYFGLSIGILVALLNGGHRSDIIYAGWFSIFMGAWYSCIHGPTLNPIGPLWSISVEEQFYLLAPWIVKLFSRTTLYGFCGLLIISSNAWLYYLGKENAHFNAIWYNAFVQFQCFAFGILLCLVLRKRLPKLSTLQRYFLLVSAWSCWFFADYKLHFNFTGFKNPGSWALIGVISLL